jgi:hypothetical protein
LQIAKEAANARENLNKANELLALSIDDKTIVVPTPQELSALEASCVGLLYAATHTVHKMGLDATNRLYNTAVYGKRFPEFREAVSGYPMPRPPGQLEFPAENAKEVIHNFLKTWFDFDPSVHVRSGHDAATMEKFVSEIKVNEQTVKVDTADPSHFTLNELRASIEPAPEHKEVLSVLMENHHNYNEVLAVMRDDDLRTATQTALAEVETFKHYLFPIRKDKPARAALDHIPPQDTFHRCFNNYYEVNYEELRTITEAIYPEKPYLDWTIALWNVFEGTQAEVDSAFEKHCQKYQDEFPSSIKCLEFGCWSLLADFKANREKIQFHNKNTEVLKRIMERHAEDKKIGAELMRNRVKQTKAKNIAEVGPDAPGLAAYKRNVAERGQDLGGKGAEKVISPEEMRRLEKAQGNIKAAKELEVLEQLEATIQRLEDVEKQRSLTPAETEELKTARIHIVRAKEMINVPDDAIQVDIFTSNPSTGEFEKTKIYTKSVAPELPTDESPHPLMQNAARQLNNALA